VGFLTTVATVLSGRGPGGADRSAAERDLDELCAKVTALHELAADPEVSPDDDQVYDFSIRWGTMLAGRLQRLDYYYRRASLTPSDAGRYQALLDELRAVAPTAKRLRLALPQVAGAGAAFE
jgi:hypothetical protein